MGVTIFLQGKPSVYLDENMPSCAVGRAPDCLLFIEDPSVSGHHGRFHWENGVLFYTDTNSKNGSFLGESRLPAVPSALADGDTVTLNGAAEAYALRISLDADIPSPKTSVSNGSKSHPHMQTIGRGETCDIVVPAVSASRLHARLETRANGFYISDANSANGTFVNGVRITGPTRVTKADTVAIAGLRFRLAKNRLAPLDAGNGLPLYARSVSRTVRARRAGKKLLDDISFTIEPNAFVAVVGGSGAGKSTLMHVLCGHTKATSGEIAFDTESTDSREAYKSAVGFAPQADALHDGLTLREMLLFAAKLKMPEDTGPAEYEARVADALRKVQLTKHENTLAGKLSGGQRKRASIAIELLSNPRIFFLDEPASGPDPSAERDLMRMLKSMAAEKQTVIVATHITQNISLCDKLIILGAGGRLCFFGTPQKALAFFGVSDYVDIYDKINTDPVAWQQKFADTQAEFTQAKPPARAPAAGAAQKSNGLRRFAILTQRNFRLLAGDKNRLLLLLLQAPLLSLLLMLVSGSTTTEGVFTYSTAAKSMLFSLTCAAFWVGMLNSMQEICKERAIYNRERLSTVRPLPYIASKLVTACALSAVQALLMLLVMRLCAGALPPNPFGIPPFAGFYLTTFLTIFCAACLGLAVSAFSPNPDRAMAATPIILLPQILFSGVVFAPAGFFRFLSNAIPCKLAVQAFGVLADVNSLPTSAGFAGATTEAMFGTSNAMNLYGAWIGLGAVALVCVAVFGAALYRNENE